MDGSFLETSDDESSRAVKLRLVTDAVRLSWRHQTTVLKIGDVVAFPVDAKQIFICRNILHVEQFEAMVSNGAHDTLISANFNIKTDKF